MKNLFPFLVFLITYYLMVELLSYQRLLFCVFLSFLFIKIRCFVFLLASLFYLSCFILVPLSRVSLMDFQHHNIAGNTFCRLWREVSLLLVFSKYIRLTNDMYVYRSLAHLQYLVSLILPKVFIFLHQKQSTC